MLPTKVRIKYTVAPILKVVDSLVKLGYQPAFVLNLFGVIVMFFYIPVLQIVFNDGGINSCLPCNNSFFGSIENWCEIVPFEELQTQHFYTMCLLHKVVFTF